MSASLESIAASLHDLQGQVAALSHMIRGMCEPDDRQPTGITIDGQPATVEDLEALLMETERQAQALKRVIRNARTS
jgi:hypothetical protein